MDTQHPPDFANIADASTKGAFIQGRPDVVQWLGPRTKLFKWTKSITNPRGITPWWQFVEQQHLANGARCPSIGDLQEYATRLGVHDRDYARTRVAVTEQWNKMTNLVAIELTRGKWGYIGRASGQRKEEDDPAVYLIGGEFQVWVPGLTSVDMRRIAILPYLTPNAARR